MTDPMEARLPSGLTVRQAVTEYEEERGVLEWKYRRANQRAAWWFLVAGGMALVALLGWLL